MSFDDGDKVQYFGKNDRLRGYIGEVLDSAHLPTLRCKFGSNIVWVNMNEVCNVTPKKLITQNTHQQSPPVTTAPNATVFDDDLDDWLMYGMPYDYFDKPDDSAPPRNYCGKHELLDMGFPSRKRWCKHCGIDIEWDEEMKYWRKV